MKEAGGEPQLGPLEQPVPAPSVLQRLATSGDRTIPGSLASQGDKPPSQAYQRATHGTLPVGPCKLAFYLFFYLAVIGLFTICMIFFYSTLSRSEPKYKLDQSLVGSSPGMGFRPMVDETSNLVAYRLNDTEARKRLMNQLDAFLEPYADAAQWESYYYDCDFDRWPPAGRVCRVNISRWNRCTSRGGYGYATGSPCVFIKLNRIYDWVPVYYNGTSDLPETMPADLREHIRSIGSEERRKVVWVSCGGIDEGDERNIGPLSYIPDRGFPGYFYPYRNQRGYLSPLVAVRFEKPSRGVMVKVECKAWARNIVHNRVEVRGMVHFQLMIE